MGKGLSMGLSDVELRVTVLAAFSLALPLYSVCSFLWAFGEVLSRRLSSATALLGLSRGSQDKLGPVKCRAGGRPRQRLSSAWAVDLKINWAWARGHNFFGPTIALQKPAARLLVGEEGFDNVGLTS